MTIFLSQLPGEKFVIPCHDNVVSANIPAKECQTLIKDLYSLAPKRGSVFIGLMTLDGAILSRYQRTVLMR